MAGVDGRKIARDAVTQLKNFFSAVLELPAAFDALEARERVVEDKERQVRDLDNSVTRLAAEETSLRQSCEGFSKKLSTLKADLKAREEPKLLELAELDKQIAERKQQLAAIKAELEAFRSRLTV